jgi:peptidoglycan/LPS O-acetylase OafA/YrhL
MLAAKIHILEIISEPFPKRFSSIDGWRALSILMVLGAHAELKLDFPNGAEPWFSWICDGNLGVRFFFVISGFLITHLLIREYVQTGGLSVRGLYARRALRILPVYFVFLAVMFALQMLTPAHQVRSSWLTNLTFTTNLIATPHVPRSQQQSPMGHLWTLAVEEQFYLIWPALLCLAGLRNTRRILWLLLVPIVVAPVCKAITYIRVLPAVMDFVFHDYSSIFYFDSLAIGCIAAVVLVRYCLIASFIRIVPS